MNKKYKDLLIKDLSARVFYGVKVNIERDFPNNPQIVEKIAKDGEIIVNGILAYDIYYYKPYLRPLSNMSSGEKTEWFQIRQNHCNMSGFNELQERADFTSESLDWLNKKGFDYRGLIPMGLALEAPEDMYKTE